MTVASPDEMRRHDALYVPFPAFASWPRLGEHLAAQWDELVGRLSSLREDDEGAFEAIRKEQLRAAAWDTGAIEGLYTTDRGFTITVATEAAHWEAEVRRAKGDDALAMFEAQLAAYQEALDAATGATPVSEAWIRHLYEVVTAAQEKYEVHTAAGKQAHDLPKGEYKTHPNHIEKPDGSVHAHAPVAATAAEMARLVSEMRSDDFAAAHPIDQAGYAHYAFVRIHPFADGNGRVARALASVFTLRAASLPLVIYADERASYLDALERADTGDEHRFSTFVLGSLVETYADVSDRLRFASALAPTDVAGLDPARLTDEQQRAAALRLMQRARLALERALRDLPPTIGHLATFQIEQVEGSPGRRPGYRSIQQSPQRAQPGLAIRATSAIDPGLTRTRNVWPMLRSDEAQLFDVVLAGAAESEIGFRFGALVPRATERTKRRLAEWAQAVLAALIQELADAEAVARPTDGPGGSGD